jgi:DNA mismatch endonuclease, patch repair protein
MDRISPAQRSKLMASVRSTNTRPELAVRRVLHRLGYRFRLHSNDLPGKPDVILPKWRVAVLVHGCFWHHHRRCPKATLPKSHVLFWTRKLNDNRRRDRKVQRQLNNLGWRVCVVWECEVADIETLAEALDQFIRQRPPGIV